MSVAEIKRLPVGVWECGCRPELNESNVFAEHDDQDNIASNDVQLAPAQLFRRYVDDIIRSIKETEIERLLEVANGLHRNLEFTIEREANNGIAFLDLYITRDNRKVTTSWYNKPTDTGVQLNYHACAPTKYKRNIVEGSVHRIHHTTSTWEAFNDSIEKLKKLWNQTNIRPLFTSQQ